MARTPVTPEDVARGQRMKALRLALGLTVDGVLGQARRPQIIEAEAGRDRLRGQLLFWYAEATDLPVEPLRAYAFGKGVTLDSLLAQRVPAENPSQGTTTMELDTHRDRLWLQTALVEAGFDRGLSADVALSLELIGSESTDETLRRAKLAAHMVRADSKGKLITAPQPPHPKKPPKVGRSRRAASGIADIP